VSQANVLTALGKAGITKEHGKKSYRGETELIIQKKLARGMPKGSTPSGYKRTILRRDLLLGNYGCGNA